MVRKVVKMNKNLTQEASQRAAGSSSPTEEEFEYYYKLGLLAEQYPDLPISMIKSLIKSTKEEANIEFVIK